MLWASAHGSTTSGTVKRIALVVLAAGLFVGVASVIKPPPQAASASPAAGVSRSARPSAARPAAYSFEQGVRGEHPKGWRLVGQLEGREYQVLCYASPEGPRFSVFDLRGRVLQQDLPPDEVYRAFPGLDIESMQMRTSDSGSLMLMDQDRSRE